MKHTTIIIVALLFFSCSEKADKISIQYAFVKINNNKYIEQTFTNNTNTDYYCNYPATSIVKKNTSQIQLLGFVFNEGWDVSVMGNGEVISKNAKEITNQILFYDEVQRNDKIFTQNIYKKLAEKGNKYLSNSINTPIDTLPNWKKSILFIPKKSNVKLYFLIKNTFQKGEYTLFVEEKNNNNPQNYATFCKNFGNIENYVLYANKFSDTPFQFQLN